ncbi:hypothetical protein D3C83_113750 [compost metagenome]
MVERGKGARLAFEADDGVAVRRDRRRQDFDRDRAAKAKVAGAIDLAHAAGADRRDDLIGADARARSEGHVDPRLYGVRGS